MTPTRPLSDRERTTGTTRGDPLHLVLFLDYDDGSSGRFQNSPGLAPLIEVTRSSGFRVDFVTRVEELFSSLSDPGVDVVGISSMERLLPRSIPVARQVRRERPDVVLMLGGNGIDPFAGPLAAGLVDVVVCGEAEHSLPALLAALARARGRGGEADQWPDGGEIGGATRVLEVGCQVGALQPEDVDHLARASFRRTLPDGQTRRIRVGNVWIRDGERSRLLALEEPRPGNEGNGWSAGDLGTAPRSDELDQLTSMPWDVLEAEGFRDLELYTQRGCLWGRCGFCSIGQKPIRRLSPSKVVEIVGEAVARGMRSVSFADDLFVQDRRWAETVLAGIGGLEHAIELRAQTTPNRTLWPLLDAMRAAGFVEIAFGLETVVPRRAEYLGKTRNGGKYVENAVETIGRTAEAGIFPVLYGILADPTSTLEEIAWELAELVRVLAEVYRRTVVLPKLSFSLILLPVAGTELATRHPVDTETVQLETGELALPKEFRVPPDVARFLMGIAEETSAMRRPRENFEALASYLRRALEVAEEAGHPNLEAIRSSVGLGLSRFKELRRALDDDVDETIAALDLGGWPAGKRFSGAVERLDHRRFGGYVRGCARLLEGVRRSLEAAGVAVP